MTFLLNAIEFAVNTALVQDQETKDKLDRFEQRRIAIDIGDFNQTIIILIEQQKLILSSSTEQQSNLTFELKHSICCN